MGRRKRKYRGSNPPKPTYDQQIEELTRQIRFWKYTIENIDEEIDACKGKILNLQVRLTELEERKMNAPEKLRLAEQKLADVHKQYRLKKLSPKIERLKRLRAQLSKLAEEIGEEDEV